MNVFEKRKQERIADLKKRLATYLVDTGVTAPKMFEYIEIIKQEW